MSTNWTDVAKQLDPNIPQKDYDAIRLRYFQDVVRPQVRKGYSVEATYNEFLKTTARPSTLVPGEKNLIKASQFAVSAVKAMLPGPMGESVTRKADQTIKPIAEREGIESPFLETAGSLLGTGIALEAMLPMAEALTGEVAAVAMKAGRTADIAQKIARGGLAFGVYDALQAKDGDRVAAGFRGALIGTGAELLTVPFMGKRANAAIESAADEGISNVPRGTSERVYHETLDPLGHLKESGPSGAAPKNATPVKEAAAPADYLKNPSGVAPKDIEPIKVVEEPGAPDYLKSPSGVAPGKIEPIVEATPRVEHLSQPSGVAPGKIEPIVEATPRVEHLSQPSGVAPGPIEPIIETPATPAAVDQLATPSGVTPGPLEDAAAAQVTDLAATTERPLTRKEARAAAAADAEKAAADAALGHLATAKEAGAKPVQVAASDAIVKTVEMAKRLGYTVGPMVETPSKAGLSVGLTDAAGNVRVLGIAKGAESDAIAEISETLGSGGSLEFVQYHPASRSRAAEIMRHFADEAEQAERPIRMMVERGKAGEVARALNKMGLRGQVADDSTVIVGPEATWLKAQKSKAAAKAAAESQKMVKEGDPLHQQLMRIGEIRNRIRLSGAGEGPAVPRPDHADLHHIAGEIGQQYGLTRSQVGQLGLRYYEQSAAGVDVSAKDLVEKYAGRGEKYGAVRGSAPPRGFDRASRLRGFRRQEGFSRAIPIGDTPAATDSAFAAADGRMKVRPVGATKLLSPEDAEGFGLGRGGGAVINTEAGPLRVMSEDATAQTAYHESIHEGDVLTGLAAEPEKHLGSAVTTGMEIGRGIQAADKASYGSMGARGMLGEAFAYAAEAVRFSSKNVADVVFSLEELGKMDGGVEGVKQFVNEASKAKLAASMSGTDAATRAFQRRLNDLIRRTDVDISQSLKNGEVTGWKSWYDPTIERWVTRNGEGDQSLHKNIEEVWDRMFGSDPSDHFPDGAETAYFRKFKGPLTPNAPLDNPPTPEIDGGLSFSAGSGLLVPTHDWAASVQSRLTKAGMDIDFYGPFKEVTDTFAKAAKVMDGYKIARDTAYKGTSSARRVDYGEVLATHESNWGRMQTALNLTGKDMANVRALADWSEKVKADSGIDLREGLQTLSRIRMGADLDKMPKTVWTEALRHGTLAPDDFNVGRISSFVIRKSIDDRFMAAPLQKIEDLMAMKTVSGKPAFEPVMWTMRNFVNHMKGIPDQSQRIIDRFVESMTGFAERRAKDLNQVLPDAWKVPEKFSQPKKIMAMYKLSLYAAGLGGRPAVLIRDLFSGVYAASILGPAAFGEGMARAMTKDGLARARAAGVLLEGRNISESFGDITGDLPSAGKWSDRYIKAADALMAPSRWGNNVHRAITYLGEEARSLRALKEITAGRAGIDSLMDRSKTALWFLDEAPRSAILTKIAKMRPGEEAIFADEIARAANDATNFPLRMGTQAAAFRTGMGSLFGQYGTWPSNYYQFARKLIQRTWENPRAGGPSMGAFLALNVGAGYAAEELGVDAWKWLMFSPAGYAGSPNTELVSNIMAAPEESQRGLEARRALHQTPMQFMPGGVQMQSLYNAFQDNDLSLVRILGFKPLKETDNSLEEWLAKEGGF